MLKYNTLTKRPESGIRRFEAPHFRNGGLPC